MNALQHARPRRKEGVTLRRSGGEIMLYDSVVERVHLMNATAAAIWELCDGDTEAHEIIVAVCQLTGLPLEVVEADVTGLLTSLNEADLIVLDEAGS